MLENCRQEEEGACVLQFHAAVPGDEVFSSWSAAPSRSLPAPARASGGAGVGVWETRDAARDLPSGTQNIQPTGTPMRLDQITRRKCKAVEAAFGYT